MAEKLYSESSQEMDDDDWLIPEQSKSIEHLFTLANKHYKDKEYKKALECYGVILERAEKATDNDKNAVHAFTKSLYMISQCHMERGNYDEAVKIIGLVCDLVLSNCPDKIHIPEQLMIKIKEQRSDLCGAFFLALIFKQLNPSNIQCEKLLSDIQEKIGDSFTENGCNIHNTFLSFMKKGKQLYKSKEYSTAVACFEKTTKVFHFLPEENLRQANIWLAKCFLMLDNLEQAQSTIEKVLHLFPENIKARKVHEEIKKAIKAKQAKQTKQAKPPKESSHPDLNKQTQKNDKLNKVPDKKTEGKDKKTSSTQKPDVSSANYHLQSNGMDSAWEGLPTAITREPRSQSLNQQLPSSTKSNNNGGNRHVDSPLLATASIQQLHQKDNQASGFSVNTSNKFSMLRSISNDGSTVPQPTSSNSPVRETEDIGSREGEPSLPDENAFQPVKSRKQRQKKGDTERKAFCLPEGVQVICEHFKYEDFSHPQKQSSQTPKVCQICQSCPSRCKYAYWSKEQNKWLNVRNVPPKLCPTDKDAAPIQNCRYRGKTCKSTCTFAHGPELQMWELERKGELPSPETYLKYKQMFVDDVVSPSTYLPKRVASPARHAQGHDNVLIRQNVGSLDGHSRPNMATEVGGNRTPVQTSRVQSSNTDEASNPYRLPKGVKIVCHDFLKDYKYSKHPNDQATYICSLCKKKCEERQSFFKYAFWSDGFKKWFVIRPFPRGVLRAVFRRCKDFENNKPCVRRECTFAHGPEQSMWTLEREGKLVQPWEALNRFIVFDSSNRLMAVVRPLPLGAVKSDLRLCKSVISRIICRFGRGCRYAHSDIELESWRKYYQDRIEKAKLPDNKQSLKHHEIQCTDSMPGVELRCNPEDPNVQLAEDCDEHSYTWEFCVRLGAKPGPLAAELLHFHLYFRFTKIEIIGFDKSNKATRNWSKELNTVHISREDVPSASMVNMQIIEYRLSVAFKASVFGSFSQRLLLNFGRQPFLKKDFTIDIGSKETLEILADRRQTVNLEDLSWEDKNMTIKKSSSDPEKEKLMSTYCLPSAERIVSAQLVEGEMEPRTYKQTMHQLLFAEEVHMRKLLVSLTPRAAVQLQPMTTKPDLRFGGIKFAGNGQLFGKIELGDIEITLDDMAGRVCLRNVQQIWIQSRDNPKCVYELPSEVHEGNTIYVDLAADVCKDLKLSEGKVVEVEMRFNLNRYILCLMHKAVDSLGNTQAQQLFPEEQDIRRRKVSEYWAWFLDQRLNDCQKHVIQSIAEVVPPSPPLVVFGPFGTGKTFTLNQAVIYLIAEKANRVLLCTHTNSAADIHVELLDKYLHGRGVLLRAAKPLRIYNPEVEWSRTSDVARKYALVKDGVFLTPTRRDIIDHRVIITTLTTADLLTKLNVHHGFFTHILIDEAAQAWEAEALIPLALAGPNTKIVFTGDHMQMSPEVYSEFASQCGLQKSLPERLFDHYQSKDNTGEQVLFLFENYRSHEEILKFPSVNCYENGIVAKGDVPCHPELPPLVFYATKGKDEKQSNNSFLNISEVYEVGKRVAELEKKWPYCWGEKKLNEIAVVAPYKYQVDAIRGELRRKRMGDVNVQTIHNIQGREFRVLLISTVRTWNSIQDSNQSEKSSHDDLSLEFLSDPKLLITAVTRAKSLVAVVGDPFALCTLGRCKILWNDYITRCHNGGGLIGITMEELDKEICDHFAQIQLNPEAPEFVPTSQNPNKDKKEHSDAASTAESTENEAGSLNNSISNLEESEEENEEDLALSCSGDVQDINEDDDCSADLEDVLEDETVLPVDIDSIIKALCKFVKQRQQQTASFDQEYPPLTKSSSKVKIAPVWPTQKPIDLKTLKSEYKILNKNGRTEIQLLDIHERRSDRVQQINRDNYKSQNLEPGVLLHLLENDNVPVKFYSGQLQIRNEKSRPAYLAIPDKEKPDIRVKGSIKHAFDHDTVVVEIQPSQNDTENISSGFLKGVLNQLIGPRERQYVCKVDRTNPSLMLPINRSVTNIVNLSDKSLKDVIPIYKKPTTNEKKVLKPMKMITVEEVLEKNLLFVVEFLQWRSDCSLPLGIAVRTLPTGETAEQCKQILFAECGIRKAFSKDTKEVIRRDFSPKWEIPESEMKDRKKIDHAFTIDPPESKDLDDAISIDDMGDGRFKVGIHIADVSFFVQRGTALDREARQRGVSYYPGQDGEEMIPMLPRELSENILSLLPNEDRLTVSVFLTHDSQGEIVGQAEILRTITRSCCRLSYSQAQQIIDMEGHDEVGGVPDQVRRDIRKLHSLAEKRRLHRLNEASFDHSNNREDADAHELIEELMILANNTVGDFLHHRNPKATPIRTQLEPKVHRLNEWAETHGSFAKYSPSLQPSLHSEDIKEEIKEKIEVEEKDIDIQDYVWEEICKAAASGNVKKAERLVCDPLSSPQLEITRLHLMRIQTRSQYTCSESDTQHYSLRLSNYTHFTSPIRRYIDIEVHRLLASMIPSNGANVEQHRLNEEDMATLCRRSTYFKENADKFEKEFKRIQFASALKEKNKSGMFFIDQLEDRFFTIHPVSPDHDRFLGKHKRIKFDALLPSSKSDVDGKTETTLTWKSRIYIAHSSGIEAVDTTRSKDAVKVKKMVNSGRNHGAVQTIPGETWLAIIKAVKDGKPINSLLQQVKRTDKNLKEDNTRQKLSSQPRSSSIYKHPNFGQTDSGTPGSGDGHFHEITLNLKQFDMVRLQMFSNLHQKMLCPDVQLLRLSSGFSICLEHQRYPLSCFACSARKFASKAEYESIDKYVRLWKPVLAMEAAHGAVTQNDGFVLKSLQVKWKQKDGTTKGKFTLMSSFCNSRQLKFHYGDLACIRIPLSQCPEDSDAATSHEEESIWIGHCVVDGVKQEKGQNLVRVTIRLHQMACKLPPQLLTTEPQSCEIQFIYQPLPQRRMILALECKLFSSSEFVQTICLGQSPPQEKFPLPNQELSLHAHYKTAGFQSLNKYQENAVRKALSTPFSLIQGPPGTGKTVTGVHIAYWFAKQNEKQKPAVVLNLNKKSRKKAARENTDQGEDGKDQAPLQVLYCGPSNKSVDVVTEYLLRIPMMKEKILRVHGTLIEETEYPIPNKVGSKPMASEDELKIPEGKVKEVSLHHYIRSNVSPFAARLKQKEEEFKKAKRQKEKASEESVRKYLEIISEAEKWAIQKTGKEIILCTCSRAGSTTIAKLCRIQQCIVDECGMCMEPEALVPMTSSNAKQFVLIGDHKQLQPIVTHDRAKKLGLDISMFERLASQAFMLQIQYRMHTSICEFPSKQFYEGKLQTSDIVKSRKTADVRIWPAKDIKVSFCHIEGEEKSTVIATVDSGVDSKYNMDEARKVVHLAKYLVNNHIREIQDKNVVILTPYRQQRKIIQDLLKKDGRNILVTTIIKSQGSEWDYVILSLVRSLPQHELEPEPSLSWLTEHLGFITDDHQINVALTRAKHGLIIIGNKNLLSYDPNWRSLIRHCEKKKCMVDKSWPFQYS